MRCLTETTEDTERLMSYISGTLDAERTRQLEQHLRTCEMCRLAVARQASVWKALDSWEAPPVSPEFDSRLFHSIDAEATLRDRIARAFRPLFLRRGLPIAAAAGLVVMAVFLSRRPAVPVTPPAPQTARMETASPDPVDRALDEMKCCGN